MPRLFLAASCVVALGSCTPTPNEGNPDDPDAAFDGGQLVDAGADAGPAPDGGNGSDGGADAGVSAPDTAAGRQLAFVLAMIDGGISSATNAEVSSHFSAAFLAAVPVATLRTVLVNYAAAAPYTLQGFDGTLQPTFLVALVSDSQAQYQRVEVGTEPTQTDKISDLFFSPAADADPTLDTWAKVEPALRAMAPSVNYLEADITSGTCVPVRSIDPDTSLALGSAFKLYVLSTLANQVDAGVHTWNETLAIRDDWKSLPSGKMQNDAVGTAYSLRTFADLRGPRPADLRRKLDQPPPHRPD